MPRNKCHRPARVCRASHSVRVQTSDTPTTPQQLGLLRVADAVIKNTIVVYRNRHLLFTLVLPLQRTSYSVHIVNVFNTVAAHISVVTFSAGSQFSAAKIVCHDLVQRVLQYSRDAASHFCAVIIIW